MIRVALLTCLAAVGTAVPAQAAFRDIYRAAGVVESTGVSGFGTAIHCTNSANATANVRVILYRHDALVMANVVVPIDPGDTATIATGVTGLFPSATNLNTGNIFQGQAVIRSDSTDVFCSIVVLDRGNVVPKFMTRLHMVKYPRGGGGED